MEETVQRENKMGTTPILRLILSMSIPAMFSMTIQALYNVVDSVFVGNIENTGGEALTALSLAFPLQMLMVAVGVGTGVGINSLVSRRLGQKNFKEADDAATHGLILALFSWVIFFLIGLFFTNTFFRLFTNNEIIVNYGVQYTSIVLIFSVFAFFQINIEKTLQATGNMIFPMLFQLTGAITNIILDPLLIFGIGPFPKLEIAGAAIATVIGQAFAMIFSIIILFAKKHDVKVSLKNFRINWYTVRNIYAVGFPSIIMQSIGSVMILGMNAILISFSDLAVSVLGVYYKLQSFVFMPVFGLNQGVMPIIGYNYGARNKKRMYSALKYGVMIAMIIMAVGVVIFWLFPEFLLGLFDNTGELVSIGVGAFRTISLCFVPAAAGIMFTTLFQAVGKGLRSLFMSFLRQLILILPIAYLMSKIGLSFVWYAFPIAEAGSLLAAILLFLNLVKGDFKKLG
ncbi:MAG: MATE family efflux transporter [Ruminococcus sp.]|nr:MATE family efflux transporter [Ruminococcus sp.]